MKSYYLIAIILCLPVFGGTHAHAQDMDTEISKLTEDLAAKISSKQCKKISVVDFTDLDGTPTDLGKYIADQMTVDFAMSNRDFEVLDRAHLKSIMDEHKLTSTGLVDPENAKQLGLLAGVDALIFGKAIETGGKVSVTVEAITVDTGLVFTAGKAKFEQDDSTKQIAVKTTPAAPETPTPKPIHFLSQTNGNLIVELNRMRITDGTCQLELTFQNKSTEKTIAVAMFHYTCFARPCDLETVLIAGDGTQYHCDDSGLMGLNSMAGSPLYLTPIDPGNQIKASIQFRRGPELSPTVTDFSLQSVLVVNQNYSESEYNNYRIVNNTIPFDCKLVTIFMDFPIHTTHRD